jgi:hypothetical protein
VRNPFHSLFFVNLWSYQYCSITEIPMVPCIVLEAQGRILDKMDILDSQHSMRSMHSMVMTLIDSL